MHRTPFTIISAALLVGGAMAQELGAYTETSEKFQLTLRSVDDKSLWGKFLKTQHAGAGIAQLVPSDEASDFYAASMPGAPTPYFSVHPVGLLAWDAAVTRSGGASTVAPSSMRFQDQTDHSPVSLALLMVGAPDAEEQPQPLVGFDREGRMYAYVPGQGEEVDAGMYYEWFICKTKYGLYEYNTLTWVHGKDRSDSSCDEVTVVRE